MIAFLARRACEPIVRLFLFNHLVRSHHLIDLDFFRSTYYRAQSEDSLTFFPLPFQRSVLMPVDSNKGVRVLTSPSSLCSIPRHIRGIMSEAIRASVRGSCRAGSQNMWEKDYKGNHVTWPAPNARFIFAQDKFKMGARSWMHQNVTILSSQIPKTIGFIDAFVSGTSESWILFF